jgi:hypothetical protein
MKTYSRSTRARRTLSFTTGIRSDLLIGILQTPLLLQTAEVSKGACPEILGEGRAHILLNKRAKFMAKINQSNSVSITF